MTLQAELSTTQELAGVNDLSTFQKNIPLSWIETVLTKTNKASIRRRKLPAEQVIWLILGMGLYRNRSITDVVDKLGLVLKDAQDQQIAPSSIVEARMRLGSTPVAELFRLTSHHWYAQDSQDTWQGLQLLGVDGTVFRLQDSLVNQARFGYINRPDIPGQYPFSRLVALMSLRNRLIIDVVFGRSDVGEIPYARELLNTVPANSLTLLDRCYFSADLLLHWTGNNRHWLTPIKSNIVCHVIKEYAPGDCLVSMKVSAQARQKNPELPETWTARRIMYQQTTGEIKGFITSLIDPINYPLKELLSVYWERWEIEMGYGEIKQKQLLNEVLLRSQTATGVEQELWGILIAYNLVRLEISQIAREVKKSPLRISFIMALRFIQDEFLWCAIASPGTIPKKLKELRANVKQFILPEKRKRPKPRTVRFSKTRYPVCSTCA